jgi:hypothetical protein
MVWMLCYPVFHSDGINRLPLNNLLFEQAVEFPRHSIMLLRQMKYLPYKKLKYRFDFEIGYLTKSPCKECEKRKDFPDCTDDCNMLDKIHTILCEAISCSKRV